MGKINIYQEAERCLLCQDASCGKKVADAVRAINTIKSITCTLVCPTGAMGVSKRVPKKN